MVHTTEEAGTVSTEENPFDDFVCDESNPLTKNIAPIEISDNFIGNYPNPFDDDDISLGTKDTDEGSTNEDFGAFWDDSER
jgi:hypothetical protein